MGKSSAQKRHDQSEKRRIRNKAVRSRVRTGIKNFRSAVAQSDTTTAETSYQSVTRLMDAAVSKGVYHRNTVARLKSRLYKRLSTIQQS
ncbi:MAG: 30S ribosomal protein S20 [Spirochaetaceae bacterium]|nr:MAG: 30S ribosomal protein S20 [Spirochaetaceae bacterium]